ncbi:hypothetical protein [Weizmannia acidilactici]|nr:hypothetical protein [Weizmannia acidilactici]
MLVPTIFAHFPTGSRLSINHWTASGNTSSKWATTTILLKS